MKSITKYTPKATLFPRTVLKHEQTLGAYENYLTFLVKKCILFHRRTIKMKKVILVLICLLMIASCGLENLPPKSFTVKGNPGLYVPIGSPFAGMEKEDRLEYQLSPENMKKKMKENVAKEGADEDVQIFLASERTVRDLKARLKEYLNEDLNIAPGVQSYLVHYPLINMPLNLKRYADNAIAEAKKGREDGNIVIPAIPPGLSMPRFLSYDETTKTTDPLETEDSKKPFVKIPFTKMAKLVKKVEGGKYGLEIDWSQELQDNLLLKIPGFGIDDYIPGIPTDNDGNPTSVNPRKLRYYDTSADPKTTFLPQRQEDPPGNIIKSDLDDEENLFVYAKITGPCSGKLQPVMIFEWEQALIDTKAMEGEKSTFMGYYPIKNTLSEFVGEGVTFKKVIGFMYMSGVKTENAKLFSAIYKSTDYDNGLRNPIKTPYDEKLHNVELLELPDGDIYDNDLYPMSITNKEDPTLGGEPLDLTEIFESIAMTLQYAITINNMWYEHKEDNNDYIKFDMLVLIPMDLKISQKITDASPNINNNYVLLDFGQSFSETLWKGDLFGRKEGEDNNIKQIEYFNVGIIRTNINIVEKDKLALLASSGNNHRTMEFRDNASLQLAGNSSGGSLLSPTFRLILKKDPNEDFGSFRILRPPVPVFDFKLYVEAKAKLEYTKNF